MERVLIDAIESQARKLLRRDEKSRYTDQKYRRRHFLRSGNSPLVVAHEEPKHWSLHPHFDPRYCLQHSKYLARIIWKRIISGEYRPIPAVKYEIPKDNGSKREVMVFGIPDAAVANVLNRKLRDRNKNILSPFCFSYLKDRGVFDAVIQLSSYLKEEKVYLVQYDFSKYFDSINHAYLNHVLDKQSVIVTSAERSAINAFLEHGLSPYFDPAFCRVSAS